MEQIKKLREELSKIKFPDSLMEMVSGEIEGNGFFPGASGLYKNSKDLMDREIMILGQDQDTKKGFLRSVKKENEEDTPTWKNLIEYLEEAEIKLENCFFTNCIPAVRKNSRTNTGKSQLCHHKPIPKIKGHKKIRALV